MEPSGDLVLTFIFSFYHICAYLRTSYPSNFRQPPTLHVLVISIRCTGFQLLTLFIGSCVFQLNYTAAPEPSIFPGTKFSFEPILKMTGFFASLTNEGMLTYIMQNSIASDSLNNEGMPNYIMHSIIVTKIIQ
jgi:hypothetical protein